MNAVQSRVSSLIECGTRLGIPRDGENGIFTVLILGISLPCTHRIALMYELNLCSGSEGVEFTSVERLLLEYEGFIKYVQARSITSLTIGLIGPTLGDFAPNSEISKELSANFRINIFTCSECFHDYIDQQDRIGTFKIPDLIALFNPGLWGYDSWLPTLASFQKLHGCCILTTSYTIEEGEDDSDTIDRHCGLDIRWCWEIELNPFGSTIQLDRKCAINGRSYFDNYAWQCFSVR